MLVIYLLISPLTMLLCASICRLAELRKIKKTSSKSHYHWCVKND